MSKREVRHFVCSLPGDANRDQIREVLRAIAVTWLDQHGLAARSVTWVHEHGGMLHIHLVVANPAKPSTGGES
jgi:hypothetical protein